MRPFTPRRHPRHFSTNAGPTFLTWRLYRAQAELTPPERTVILEMIRREDVSLGEVIAAVVMNDHVHVLFRLAPGIRIQRLAQSWKSISSHQLTREFGRVAPVWQRDYFDRTVRSIAGVERCTRYILDNPSRRWPELTTYPWMICPSTEEDRASGPA